MQVHRERAGLANSDRVSGKLGRRVRYRSMLLTRAPPVEASLHSHLSRHPKPRIATGRRANLALRLHTS